MLVDAAFRDWVLLPENYLSYMNEIQYYSGLSRDSTDVLEAIAERFAALSQRSTDELKWNPDARRLNSFRFVDANGEDTESMLAAFEQQLAMPPLSPEERDEVLDASLPEDVESRQEVYRPKPTDVGSQTLLCLFLYSGVLRNLELIPDAEKRKHLRSVIQGWCLFTMSSFMVVPMLAKHRRMTVNGVAYEVNVPKHFSEGKVARILYNSLPAALSDLILIYLGTEKLEMQLSQPDLEDSSEAHLATFFRKSLLTDLHIGEWWRHLPTLMDEISDSPYLTEAFLWKMRDIYLMNTLPKQGMPLFRKSIATGITRLRGASGADRSKQISAELQKLNKQELLRRIRLQTDERSGGSAR
jgi:hypothetical protein